MSTKSMSRYPVFHKSLMTKELYPEAKHKIQFTETRSSWLYKTGETIYKIKKTSPEYANTAVKEAYCREEFRLGKIFDPELYLDVIPICQNGEDYAYGTSGQVVEYALKTMELNERYLMSVLLEKKKITPTYISRIAKKLAIAHEQCAVSEKEADVGRPENFYNLFEETLYQLKRYMGSSVSQPLLDMLRHPVEKFITENRKLFMKRIKKGRILHGHGAFIPEHIYIRGQDIHFLSPQEINRKVCSLDAANDVASLSVELVQKGESALSEILIKRYIAQAKDRELLKMLPAYQSLIALRRGLDLHETPAESEAAHVELNRLATSYFNLAVQFARTIKFE
ncbi:MAG: hypothetical protein HQM11_05655 [SAR324 cluster bacterium]|nr:hypothetical protein [SAR324 cluster bacterium]